MNREEVILNSIELRLGELPVCVVVGRRGQLQEEVATLLRELPGVATTNKESIVVRLRELFRKAAPLAPELELVFMKVIEELTRRYKEAVLPDG